MNVVPYSESFHRDDKVAMKTTPCSESVVVSAIVLPTGVADNTTMPSQKNMAVPGATIFNMRESLGLSQRKFAMECRPELDHTTIRRVELNQGYTQDTLERLAATFSRLLQRKVRVEDFFLPPGLAKYAELPSDVKARIDDYVADAAIVHQYKNKGNPANL